MLKPSLPARDLSRAVLIGTSEYTSQPNLPSVAHNLEGLRDVLTHRDYGGFAPEHCYNLLNDKSTAVFNILENQAKEATDTLLIYYAGHGCLDLNYDFYLSVRGTDPQRPWIDSLDYTRIRNILEHSRAGRRVLILDCCHSGSALTTIGNELLSSRQDQVRGTYILTATGPNEKTLAPAKARYTNFTGALLRLLKNGIPDAAQLLELRYLFSPLWNELHERGLPEPQTTAGGTIGHLALVRNRAYRSPKSPAQSARRPAPKKPAPGFQPTAAKSAPAAATPVPPPPAPPVQPPPPAPVQNQPASPASEPPPVRRAMSPVYEEHLRRRIHTGIGRGRRHGNSQADTGASPPVNLPPTQPEPAPPSSPSAPAPSSSTPPVQETQRTVKPVDPRYVRGRRPVRPRTPPPGPPSASAAPSPLPQPGAATTLSIGRVNAAALSGDGQAMAAASEDRVTLWTSPDGRGRVLADSSAVTTLAFDPGNQLLAGGAGQQVKLWDTATGQLQATLADADQLPGLRGVRSVVFCPHCSLVALAGSGRAISLWDYQHKQAAGNLDTDKKWRPINRLLFSPDGGWLASAGGHIIHLYNHQPGSLPRTLRGHQSWVNTLAFSPQGLLASGSHDGTVRLWNIREAEPLPVLNLGVQEAVTQVAFSPDGRQLAIGGTWSLWLWNLNTGQHVQLLPGAAPRITALAFTPDYRLFVGGGHNKSAWIDFS